MGTLSRWAGYLAIAGGALIAIVSAVVAVAPDSPAWIAFFLVLVFLGAAVPGFHERTKATTGQLGRYSAWLSAVGAAALLVAFVYSAATGGLQMGSDYDPSADPMTPVWIVTAVAWFLGNLGYAVALIRARALSTVGAWLVLVGAIVGLLVSAVLGENLPPAAYLLFGLFGIGWVIVGYATIRPSGRMAT